MNVGRVHVLNDPPCLVEDPRGFTARDPRGAAARQRLTLIHFSAQRKRFLWEKECMQGSLRGCAGGVKGYQGVFGVCIVSETAQVELKSGRV